MKVYDGIIQGLEEAIAFNEGKLQAKTKTISVAPVEEFKSSEIKRIRNEMGMTQALFAGFIGVSPKTVEAWESGRNTPNGPASRILAMVKADPSLPQKMNIIVK